MRFSFLAAVTISLTILCVQSAPNSLTDAPVAGTTSTFLAKRARRDPQGDKLIQETKAKTAEAEEKGQELLREVQERSRQQAAAGEKRAKDIIDRARGQGTSSFAPGSGTAEGFDWKAESQLARELVLA
jgi:hypothetical protein